MSGPSGAVASISSRVGQLLDAVRSDQHHGEPVDQRSESTCSGPRIEDQWVRDTPAEHAWTSREADADDTDSPIEVDPLLGETYALVRKGAQDAKNRRLFSPELRQDSCGRAATGSTPKELSRKYEPPECVEPSWTTGRDARQRPACKLLDRTKSRSQTGVRSSVLERIEGWYA